MKRDSLGRSRLDSVTDWDVRAEHASYRVAALARQCGVSERHLRRYFLIKKGSSLRSWLTERRLARAACLLRRSSLVKEAADDASFKHPADFTRCFKQHYGVLPSTFRSALSS